MCHKDSNTRKESPSHSHSEPTSKRQRLENCKNIQIPAEDKDHVKTVSTSTESIASRCQTSTLFVGGLHPRVAEVHIHKLFSPYGTVERVHRVTHREGPSSGQPKGYAFVEYGGKKGGVESARLAIRTLEGKQLLGKSLVVRPARERSSREGLDGGEGSSVPSDPIQRRQERNQIESKIEAVKRAIEEKNRGAL